MQKSSSLFALLVALPPSAAIAADLPSQKTPVIDDAASVVWTGAYVGLNAGGIWGLSNNSYISSWPSYISPFNPPPNPSAPPDYSAAAILGITGTRSTPGGVGFLGGGQAGYKQQFNEVLVSGVEADIQGVAFSNGTSAPYWINVPITGANLLHHAYLTGTSVGKNLTYLSTVRGQIGYLVRPALLLYVTGGLAFGGVSLSLNGSQTGFNVHPDFLGVGPGYSSLNGTQVGWTAGGGVEWMFMPNWSARAEFIYYDLGSVRTNAGYTVDAQIHGAPQGINFINGSQVSSQFNGNVARLGVNYHFNLGPAPVLAKY